MPYSADALRSLLAENERLLRHCQAVDQHLLAANRRELARVAQRISTLKPGGVVVDGSQAVLYRALLNERDRLERMSFDQ